MLPIAVLLEALRMRPPAGFLIPKITQDSELDGYPLQAGALALMNIYNIHHPQLWANPE